MRRLSLVAALVIATATVAGAQTQRPIAPSAPASQPFAIRGFADVGRETFQAKQSFDAVFGTASGMLLGGGVEVLAPHGLFAGVRASRFRATGDRAFAFNGTIFHVGIPDTVTVTPLEITAGYRFVRRGWRVVPYAGSGVGWHRCTETSRFSDAADDVSQTFVGYHVAGGAEVPIWRWIAAAGEAQWSTVPHALGQDPNGLSSAFHETNLGGATVRVKIVIGR